jgi:hypothetical protein
LKSGLCASRWCSTTWTTAPIRKFIYLGYSHCTGGLIVTVLDGFTLLITPTSSSPHPPSRPT